MGLIHGFKGLALEDPEGVYSVVATISTNYSGSARVELSGLSNLLSWGPPSLVLGSCFVSVIFRFLTCTLRHVL